MSFAQGYSDVAAGLEAVSEAKGALDEAKGAVLSQVSSTVEAITAALRQKKAQLAPQVAELRSRRAACTVSLPKNIITPSICIVPCVLRRWNVRDMGMAGRRELLISAGQV
jgi:hypothetical protein